MSRCSIRQAVFMSHPVGRSRGSHPLRRGMSTLRPLATLRPPRQALIPAPQTAVRRLMVAPVLVRLEVPLPAQIWRAKAQTRRWVAQAHLPREAISSPTTALQARQASRHRARPRLHRDRARRVLKWRRCVGSTERSWRS